MQNTPPPRRNFGIPDDAYPRLKLPEEWQKRMDEQALASQSRSQTPSSGRAASDKSSALSGNRSTHRNADSRRNSDSRRSNDSCRSSDSYRSTASHRNNDSYRNVNSRRNAASHRNLDSRRSSDSYRSTASHRNTDSHRNVNSRRSAASHRSLNSRRRTDSYRNPDSRRNIDPYRDANPRKSSGSHRNTASGRPSSSEAYRSPGSSGRQRSSSRSRPSASRRTRAAAKRARARQVRRQRTVLLLGIIAILILITSLVWNTYTKNKKQKEMEAAAAAAQQQQQEEADALALEEQNTLTLLAAGDNMFYDRILTSGSKNNWNFDFLYSRIAEDIQAADFAITSQGSVFTSDHNSVSGYPLFAAPTEAADAQAAAGFDAILHASSLTFAFGESGVLNTLEFWKQNHPEIYPLGIHASQTDADTVAVAEVKNFKISMLNMCQEFSSSGFTSENSYLIDVLSRARVTALVSKAKKEGNLVVFFLNAGTAGTEEPDEAMQEWVEFLVDEGVDIIIGSGSHVVQSYEMLENDDGHKTLVYYSLGNLVSTQESVSGLLGGMAQITVKRSEVTHEVYVEDYTMLPTVMHYNEKKDNFQVYPLDEYTSELAEEHDIHQYSDEEFTLSSIRTRFRELSAKITEQAPESSADSMQEENAEPEAKSDSAAE